MGRGPRPRPQLWQCQRKGAHLATDWTCRLHSAALQAGEVSSGNSLVFYGVVENVWMIVVWRESSMSMKVSMMHGISAMRCLNGSTLRANYQAYMSDMVAQYRLARAGLAGAYEQEKMCGCSTQLYINLHCSCRKTSLLGIESEIKFRFALFMSLLFPQAACPPMQASACLIMALGIHSPPRMAGCLAFQLTCFQVNFGGLTINMHRPSRSCLV
jgi:hypothetical protein